MEAILMPVAILVITGVLMGLFLAFASKKFEVEVDPKVEAIMAILPGVNCGGCGYPGCTGYAIGVVEEGISMTLCAPGGPKVAKAIGDIMGVAVEVPVKKKPAKPAAKKPAPAVSASSAAAISADKEFIEKNKRMLNSFKEAFDAKDQEKMDKFENLAKMAKKDELLKYYEEIKAGKIVPDPSTIGNPVSSASYISADKEFIEKNKRMLNSFKEAFDAKDQEKMDKFENLAKMAKKDELLKYYEEIKAGKSVPDPSTLASVTEKTVEKAVDKKETVSTTDENKEKEAANYCSILGDGLCVPEQNEVIKAGLLKEELDKNLSLEEKEKAKEAANYCSILGDGLCVPEQNIEIAKELDKEMR